jgi:hypothetical protein
MKTQSIRVCVVDSNHDQLPNCWPVKEHILRTLTLVMTLVAPLSQANETSIGNPSSSTD